MKLKIRQVADKLDYDNVEALGFNFYCLKIIQTIKYIILYTED